MIRKYLISIGIFLFSVAPITVFAGSEILQINPLDENTYQTRIDEGLFSTSTDSNGYAYWNNYASAAPNVFFWNASGSDASSSPSATQITGLNSGNLYIILEGYSFDNGLCSNESCVSAGTSLGSFSVDGHTLYLVKFPSFSQNSRSGLYLPNIHMTYQGRIYMTNYTTDDLGSLITDQASLYSYLNFHKTPPLLHEITSNITSNTTWHSGDVYKVSGNVTVDSGVTLTIEPHTTIKFDTATMSGVTVNGTLDAEATSSDDSIVFTSWKDDLVGGGDTNGDGNATSPAAGDWGGITVNSGGSATFSYAVIRYGGTTTPATTPMLFNNGGTLNVATSTIAYSASDGIKTSAGTTTISDSDVAFNDYGLYLSGGSISITATSTLHDNSSYSAFNATTATSSFFAENNYWATTTGPYNATYNPTGTTTSQVSNYVDFDPWIGKSTTPEPHYLIDANCHSEDYCGSVPSGSALLLLDASTTPYIAETSAATSTWNGLNKILITDATSTPANVAIYATSTSDVAWKGEWLPPVFGVSPNPLYINTYYLDSQTFTERQNTITHELGHALGLDHSYTGNVMYFAQSTQTALGPQDISDYNYLW